MGFCWLCSGGFLLVMGVKYVSLAVLDGVAICLVVGHGCHHWFSRGLWVSLSMWPWAMGRGGSVSCYNDGSVVGCVCVMGYCLICGARLVVLWVVIW